MRRVRTVNLKLLNWVSQDWEQTLMLKMSKKWQESGMLSRLLLMKTTWKEPVLALARLRFVSPKARLEIRLSLTSPKMELLLGNIRPILARSQIWPVNPRNSPKRWRTLKIKSRDSFRPPMPMFSEILALIKCRTEEDNWMVKILVETDYIHTQR